MSWQAGWYPDPVGGHELRYHDGSTWTAHVSDQGVVSGAPLGPETPAVPEDADATVAYERVGPDRRRLVVGIGAAAVVIALLALVVPRLLHRGPSFPEAWDARVKPIVAFVEVERGLTFKHPVAVDFLDDATFTKEATSDAKDLTDEDRAEIEQATASFRALGLIAGDVDLFAESNDLTGKGVVGLYIPADERIEVRGSVMTPEVRATLAHELTHALQDQHFDIEREFETDGANAAFRAMIEGDAELVGEAYRTKALAADDTPAPTDEATTEAAEAAYADAPPILTSFFTYPYILGDAFLRVAIAAKGNSIRDQLIKSPPATEEQLMDPWRYLAGDPPVEVPVPPLGAGEEEVEHEGGDDFGAVAWYLVLAQRIDPKEALAASEGWGGDAYSLFRRGGKVCVRAVYRGDTEQDTAAMAAALTTWRGDGPAVVTTTGGQVTLEACDPGTSTAPSTARAKQGAARELMVLPAFRSYVSAGLAESGASDVVSRCVGEAVIDHFSSAQLTDPTGSIFTDPASLDAIRELAIRCRTG